MRVHDVVNPRLAFSEQEGPGWVSDLGQTLSDEERRRLNSLIDEVVAKWRVEIGVVVLDSLPKDTNPSGFAAALLNYWGVGDKRLHTGVVVLLLLGQRRLEMRVGYGMGRILTPAKLQEIQQVRMLPYLKAGSAGGALEAMLVATMEALEKEGPNHWRSITAKDPDKEKNSNGWSGGQTPIDEFLPPKEEKMAAAEASEGSATATATATASSEDTAKSPKQPPK